MTLNNTKTNDMLIDLNVNLPLFKWRENDMFVAFTPALELSTYADNEAEVDSRFHEAVMLWFETAIEQNKLDDLLSEYGWTKINNIWDCPFKQVTAF